MNSSYYTWRVDKRKKQPRQVWPWFAALVTWGSIGLMIGLSI